MIRYIVAALLFIFAVTCQLSAAQSMPASAKLTLSGALKTGVVAVGAESTGITLTIGRNSFELDIKDAGLRRRAEELSGQEVTVTGMLTIKQGVEVAQRRIISVETLEAAKGAGPPATAPK